ncbi:MAG: GDSL-type esterase/lipase family protein [Lentimicrobiaceae bacterium]
MKLKVVLVLVTLLILYGVGSAAATADQARCAPYLGNITTNMYTTGIVGGDTSGLTYINTGQAVRFEQTGTVNQVQFYAENTDVLTELYIIISRKDEGTGLFSVVYTTANLKSSVSDGLNVLTVSMPVVEGDYYGVRVKTSTAENTAIMTLNTATYEYQSAIRYTNAAVDSNFNWLQGLPTVGTFDGTLAIDFYMQAPMVVFIGDSIISGHPLSYACTPQVEGANFIYYTKVIPYKFQTVSGYSYQNMGISGDTYPNLYNRFAKDVLAKNPQYAIIEGGVNNLASGDSAATIFPYIQNTITAAQSAGVPAIVVLVLPAYGYLDTTKSQQCDDLNDMIIAYHTTNPDFSIVDAREAIGTYSSVNGWSLDAEYKSDTVHLNEAGNTLLAQCIYDSMQPGCISPVGGVAVTTTYPPLYSTVNFVWDARVSGTSQIEIAEDAGFLNIIATEETTSESTDIQLPAGEYFWRVRVYTDGSYSGWSYVSTFEVVNTITTSGTGVHGSVYESLGLGKYKNIQGALVTVYNDTYSVTKTTGTEGYYQVLGLTNGTYYVTVKATDYDSSDIMAVSIVSGSMKVQNVALQAAQSYFSPNDCIVTVKQHWYSMSGVANVAYSVYTGEATTAIKSGTTDSNGALVLEDVTVGTKYRIELVTQIGTQVEYITPSTSKLSFIIVLDTSEEQLTPGGGQFYDVVNVTVDKEVLNTTAASVTVTWNGTNSDMTKVYYRIGQTANNGTFVMLNDYIETPTGTAGSKTFIVTNYIGEAYKVIVEFTEGSFGTVEKIYTVTFAGSTVPFIGGKALAYFGVFLVFIVAMMFGKAEHAVGGLMVCGFSWFLWYLDVFTGFGATTNTTMAAGLVIGTVFALLAVINEARKGANI